MIYVVKKTLFILAEKILIQNLDPITITLDQQGNQHQDILRSFEDQRCIVDVRHLIERKEQQHQIYLTPLFLELFDFHNTADRYLLI